jgi:hypothetical protein
METGFQAMRRATLVDEAIAIHFFALRQRHAPR